MGNLCLAFHGVSILDHCKHDLGIRTKLYEIPCQDMHFLWSTLR